MKYPVLLRKDNGHFHARAVGTPVDVQAATRREALERVRSELQSLIEASELVEIEIGEGAAGLWGTFGVFSEDPSLDELFDEIERRRAESE